MKKKCFYCHCGEEFFEAEVTVRVRVHVDMVATPKNRALYVQECPVTARVYGDDLRCPHCGSKIYIDEAPYWMQDK